MPNAQRLSEFAAVVASGSISAAARQLDLPRATLSRRMSGLEAELGVRLLHRNTQRLVLTPAGEELGRRARLIVAEATAAWEAVRRLDDVPRGLLRVSTTGSWLDGLFVEFATEFPEVALEVRDTTRHVDLVGEGVDVAVRFGPVMDSNLIVRKVASGRRIVVGSPAYLRRRGHPTDPAELNQHACLVDFAGDFSPRRAWPLLAGGVVNVTGPLAGNANRLLAEGARRGLGLALLPWPLIASDVASGALVPVLEHAVGGDASVSVVYADREYIDPKVRAFVDRAVPVLEAAATAQWLPVR